MTIQQISHFIAVAQHLHFGEAAKELYIAQPALSNSIAALEGEITAVKAEQEKCASDYVALQDLQERQAALEARLEEKLERWVYLNDLAERIAGQ